MEAPQIITIKIHKDKLVQLIESDAFGEGEYTIIKVDVPDYDYSSNDKWKLAKAAATHAYSLLKKIEFEIRNP